MASTPYYYGTFNLNDGINYYLLDKNLDFNEVKSTLQKVARLDGMKKTGEVLNERIIQARLKVISTVSRADLESKIDALFQALALRQQQLKLHAFDGRYFMADAIKANVAYSSTTPLSVVVSVTFLCVIPYAYAAATSTYDTGNVTLSLVSGTTYQFTPFSFSGGGNAIALPQIRLINQAAVAWTSVTVFEATDSRQIALTAGLPSALGDYLDIFCDPNAGSGYTVQKNSSGTPLGFTGIFPVLQPGSTLWNITIVVSSGTPIVEAIFTWTPRWLA